MRHPLPFLLLAALLIAPAMPVLADDDVDGPDCGRTIDDFGDAPEGFPIFYVTSPIGHFPTCLAPGAPGTQEASCPAISSAPGPTGYMKNVQFGASNYWLGCYPDPLSALWGIDSESDGKTNPSGSGASLCSAGVTVDCDYGFPVSVGQDECNVVGPPGTAGDAGVSIPTGAVVACVPMYLNLNTANCGQPRQAYLNVLVDWNQDGDWNDVVVCDPPQSPCTYEWSIKNVPIAIPTGCANQASPTFLGGPNIGYSWMRVSITDEAVDNDFPWAGSANRPSGFYTGGETEDYRVLVVRGDPVSPRSWGGLKIQYR